MERLAQLIGSHALSILFFGALAALVVITSILGKPKRRAATTDFPAPLGVKLIAWASMAVWLMLLFAPLDLGLYWLAALFALGPAYTIWRWPETISIDELQISRSAWCHPKVSIRWEEIESLSTFRDTFVLSGRSGDKIKISRIQVGADELFREIVQHSGIVNERLYAARLLAEWDAAVRASNRERMLDLLGKVGLEDQAEWITDTILSNSHNYGF